ncbi:hypothetical protein [Lactobacillus sp. PSON]|uniref:hypothetical protein n=1 Tax=Lactobacillus sp. PSON TaxID=3455454 RepID=UPI00404337A3
MIKTYGLAPNLKNGKGGHQSPTGKLGIELNYNKYGVNGTANSKYIHDKYFTGFLVANENEKTGKLNTPGQPFGPTRSKFKYSWEGGKDSTTDTKKMSKWIVYMHPNNNED